MVTKEVQNCWWHNSETD